MFIHSSINRYSWVASTSWLLWIMGVKISLWDLAFSYFGYVPRSGTAESYGSSIFNFLRNHHIVFHSTCTILQSLLTVHKVSNFFTSLPTLIIFWVVYLFVCFGWVGWLVGFCCCLIIAILIGERWYLIVTFICIFLMINDAEHLFPSLLVICTSSLEKCLFKSFAHF